MSRPNVSFEFFPPKSLDQSFRLWNCATTLAPLDPTFVSVTYGAGGTTRQLTHEAVGAIRKNIGVTVAAHLTCVEATREETLDIANAYADVGVTEIVALRGDPPKGATGFQPAADGFQSSVELIEALANTGKFKIRVGAYPEKHPESPDTHMDVEWLKRKIDAGAHSAITQFFFEADTFFRFRDACEKAGIDAPILPGILPIENWKGARKFANMCGTSIPQVVTDAFERAETQADQDILATALATELCDELIAGGVNDLHFYTLNKPDLTRDVCHALGISPSSKLENVA